MASTMPARQVTYSAKIHTSEAIEGFCNQNLLQCRVVIHHQHIWQPCYHQVDIHPATPLEHGNND